VLPPNREINARKNGVDPQINFKREKGFFLCPFFSPFFPKKKKKKKKAEFFSPSPKSGSGILT